MISSPESPSVPHHPNNHLGTVFSKEARSKIHTLQISVKSEKDKGFVLKQRLLVFEKTFKDHKTKIKDGKKTIDRLLQKQKTLQKEYKRL